MTQHTEINEETAPPCGRGDVGPSFQAILEHVEDTGETRIIAHQPDGIAELGVMGWAVHALESDWYLAAKRGLMAEEGISREKLGDMSAVQRAVFEARVFDRLRTDYAMGVTVQAKPRKAGKHRSFCWAVPIPDP